MLEHFPNQKPILGEGGLKVDKPMCSQDPFELTHNVCRNLPEKAVRNIISHLQEARNLMKNCIEQEAVGGLLCLFGMDIQPLDDKIFETAIDSLLIDLHPSVHDHFQNHIRVPLDKRYLSWYCSTNYPDAVSMETVPNLNVEVGSYLIALALGDCLKLIEGEQAMDNIPRTISSTYSEKNDTKDLTTTSDNKDNSSDVKIAIENDDTQKRSAAQDLSDVFPSKRIKSEIIASYKLGTDWCVNYPVWVGRKKMATILEESKCNLSVIEWESMLSDRLCSGDFDQEIVVRVHLVSRKDQNHFWIGLEKIQSDKKSFDNLVRWLISYIP